MPRALDLNFYLGIGGVVTFKNGKIDQFLTEFPIGKMLLETDSYLAPTPYRGLRTKVPATIIANRIAELFGITPVEVGESLQKTPSNYLVCDKFLF